MTLKGKVVSDNNSVNDNVNIPIRLLTTIGEIADKMTTMVPADARKEMETKGIDISSIDFAKIIEEIISILFPIPLYIFQELLDCFAAFIIVIFQHLFKDMYKVSS